MEQSATPEPSAAAKDIEYVKEVPKSTVRPQTVIGVKTLASSFVAGETMK